MATVQKMKKTNSRMNSSRMMTKDFFTLHAFQIGKNYSPSFPKHPTLMTKNHKKKRKEDHTMDDSDIVSKESTEKAPTRVIVLDDLMNDAFNSKDKNIDSMMKLLMTKLSHHNNISVLIVCHELKIIIITLQAPFHHNGLLYGNFWVLHMGMRKSV